MMRLKQWYWSFLAGQGRAYKLLVLSIVAEIKHLFTPLAPSNKTNFLSHQLVVSLTSYTPRFKDLHKTLKTLVNQSLRPDKIVLWLSYEDKNNLPEKVKQLQKQIDFFEIRYCDDLGPGKKIIPSLEVFPESIIVVCDDDICYHNHWLISLAEQWNGSANSVVAHRVHRIIFNDDTLAEPYCNWQFEVAEQVEDKYFFATGGAGTLFPPNCFHPEILNKTLYMDMTLKQDDVWINCMLALNKSKVTKSSLKGELVCWWGSQDVGLFNSNVETGENDKAINKMLARFNWPNNIHSN